MASTSLTSAIGLLQRFRRQRKCGATPANRKRRAIRLEPLEQREMLSVVPVYGKTIDPQPDFSSAPPPEGTSAAIAVPAVQTKIVEILPETGGLAGDAATPASSAASQPDLGEGSLSKAQPLTTTGSDAQLLASGGFGLYAQSQRLSVSSGRINEDTGDVDLEISLSPLQLIIGPSPPRTWTVRYATADRSATAGQDYSPVSGVVTFEDRGSPSRIVHHVTIPIHPDAVYEHDESFVLEITEARLNGQTLPRARSWTGEVTIANDERAPALSIVGDPTVAEGQDREVVFYVRPSGPTSVPFSVEYATVQGSAAPYSDYTPRQGRLSWSPDDMSPKRVRIAVSEDGISEPTEQFQLKLFNARDAKIQDGLATQKEVGDCEMRSFALAGMIVGSLVAFTAGPALADCGGCEATACSKSASACSKSACDKPKDIVATAVKAGQFKTLAAALKAADLVETLQGKGPFTVFAPKGLPPSTTTPQGANTTLAFPRCGALRRNAPSDALRPRGVMTRCVDVASALR